MSNATPAGSTAVPEAASRDGDVTTDPVDAPPAGVPVGHAGARVDIAEQRVWCLNGFAALLIGLLLVIGALAAFVWGAAAPRGR